jgi:hypothetical protein
MTQKPETKSKALNLEVEELEVVCNPGCGTSTTIPLHLSDLRHHDRQPVHLQDHQLRKEKPHGSEDRSQAEGP